MDLPRERFRPMQAGRRVPSMSEVQLDETGLQAGKRCGVRELQAERRVLHSREGAGALQPPTTNPLGRRPRLPRPVTQVDS